MEDARRRAGVLAGHLQNAGDSVATGIVAAPCLEYASPELNSGKPAFDIAAMRQLLDGHDLETRDYVFNLMASSPLFHSRRVGRRLFLGAQYNQTMEAQQEATMRRIDYLLRQGLFKGWLTDDDSPEAALRISAICEYLGMFDHSLAIKLGSQFNFWGGAIKYLGSKRHRDKWLQKTEDYLVKGCFAMTELGHGSNVRGIETVTTYDPSTQEFVINTPCESAQKYWIGGAATATHAIVFSQLLVNGKSEGVHALIAQIREDDGRVSPGVRIADCGHKTGLNGVDNGRIWFHNVRVPRVNLLNSVADVTPDGQYVSSIADPDQRFASFLAPLTSGRVIIAVTSIYQAKLGLATAIRYALSRRAFATSPDEPEVLLLDYPSHQRRLLPLVAKTYALSFAAYELKRIYFKRRPADAKVIHVLSSGYKVLCSGHSINTLQECREACGGQGLKTENKVGLLKAEYDVQLTFEGDNKVLMQQVSKALLTGYLTSEKKLRGLGLEHLNWPRPDSLAGHELNLRESGFQVSLFRLRERDLLEKLAQRVKCLLSEGYTMAQALLESYQLAEELARAFSERSILETFLSVETNASRGEIKGILGLLRCLYVAATIDEDPVFLRHGCLSPEQSLRVQAEIAKLCAEIRPHALTLVDAFGIPAPFLGPIAFDWIAANAWTS